MICENGFGIQCTWTGTWTDLMWIHRWTLFLAQMESLKLLLYWHEWTCHCHWWHPWFITKMTIEWVSSITGNHKSDPSNQILQGIGSCLITDLPTFEVELGSGMRMIMSCSTVLPEITKMPVVIEQWKIDVQLTCRCIRIFAVCYQGFAWRFRVWWRYKCSSLHIDWHWHDIIILIVAMLLSNPVVFILQNCRINYF